MDMNDKRINEIQEFWDKRANQFGTRSQATLGEKYLRQIEIDVMVRMIRSLKPARVLDVGCGNGYSTKIYARQFPNVEFVGIDYSVEMIKFACIDNVDNCSFTVSDILDIESFPPGEFDLVFTQRCVQNLPEYSLQKSAIQNLIDKKNQRGMIVMMECSSNGVEQMNAWRRVLFKKKLEGIEPWHNKFLVDETLQADFDADIKCFCSTYMFLTRVVWPRLGVLGYWLPQVGNFGYDKMYILK
jgi:SAM-dependent methyltransferase